jgi:WD40 repeat protein
MVPVGMERFTASARPTLEECLRLAAHCDVYVGVLAYRYGWIPPGNEKSITELEYQAAKNAGRPRFMFVLDEGVQVDPNRDFDTGDDRWEKQKKLDAFKAHSSSDQMPGRFHENELQAKVLHALLHYRDSLASKHLSRAPPPGLCAVPPLPMQYIARAELSHLQSALLSRGTSRVGLVGKPVGVQGMGGVGKTIAAAALANSAAVRRAFPDGIYWLTFGQTPDLSALQLLLLHDLNIDVSQLDTDSKDARVLLRRQALRAALRTRTCLLVLDDLWDGEHVERAFSTDIAQSKLLLTSRRRDVLQVLGAQTFEIGQLEESDALQLLAAHADVGALPHQAQAIVERCGGVALAIAMAGSMLREEPHRWENVLHKLEQADMKAIEARFPGSPHRTLFTCLDVSVFQLPGPLRERYVELAVFPEDEPIPELVLQTYWSVSGMTPYQVQDAIDVLFDRALVRKDEADRIVLHDLQCDYVKATAGDRLQSLHSRLVDTYSASCAGSFHETPDDGYFFGHIAEHFVKAGRIVELRALLFDVRWLAAKLRATGIDGLLSDFEHLTLETDLPAILLRDTLGLSCHVLRSRPEELMAQLVGRLLDVSEPDLVWVAQSARAQLAVPSLVPQWGPFVQPGAGLLRTFEGHTARVMCVALSADGTRALSGSGDYKVNLWDTRSGELLRVFHAHTARVNAVVLSRDMAFALSGSDDRKLMLWDTRTGDLLRTFAGHTDSITAVALSADGERALSGSRDCSLKFWDARTGQLLRTFKYHEIPVNSVALSADGTLALSGSDDKTVLLWDPLRGEPLKRFAGQDAFVSSAALSADGTRAFSGAIDGSLRLWDVHSGELLQTIQGHIHRVNSVALSIDGMRALSGSADETLKLWEPCGGALLRTFKGHADWVHSVALSTDGSRALSGSFDRTLKLWDMSSSELLRTLEAHADWASTVALSADGTHALSGSVDQTLKLWDTRTGELIRTFQGHTDTVSSVILSEDGTRALSGSRDSTLKLWDARSGRLLRTFRGHKAVVNSVALSADGMRALSGSDDWTLMLWDTQRGELLQTFEGHTDLVNSVVLSRDGTRALSGSDDCTLILWDTRSGTLLQMFEGHTAWVHSVALNADGTRAVSGSADHTLKLWDTRSGELLQSFEGHVAAVNSVALSADGTRILSGSVDKTMKLAIVHPSTYASENVSFTADAEVCAVALASDGSLALAGDTLGRVHVFAVRVDSA